VTLPTRPTLPRPSLAASRPALLRALYLALLAGGLALLGAWWIASANAEDDRATRWIEGVVGGANQLNPLLAVPGTTDADLAALIFDGLIRIDADGTPLPDLAERWEVTPDGLTYTFVLRDDVSWHDGRPLTTADVARTIELVQAADFPGPPALAANWQTIDPFVIDERTILLRIPDPAADFLSRLAVGIIPAHRLEGVAAADLPALAFNARPTGTGPYRLSSLNGDRAILERNTSYHRGAPLIERVELRFYPNATRQLEALVRGEIDAALRGEQPDPRETQLLAERPELDDTLLLRHAFTVLYINNQRFPFDDVDLRRAIAASLDPAQIVSDAGIRGLPGDGVLVPGSWVDLRPEDGDASDNSEEGGVSDGGNGSDATATDPPDPAAPWTAAGYERDADGRLVRGGNPLTIELLTNADATRIGLAQALAAALNEQGVTVEVTPLPATELLTRRLVPRDYELALFGWEANIDPDPYLGWHTSQISETGRNIAGFQDAAADALLEAARLTLDAAERRDLYAAFADRFAGRAASVILLYPARLYIHRDTVEGFTPGLLFTPADRFRDIHLWRLAPTRP